jgi:hypothetical protein
MLPGRLLRPFGASEESLKLDGYWDVILPGSKRYLSDLKTVGDNTDGARQDPTKRSRVVGAVVAVVLVGPVASGGWTPYSSGDVGVRGSITCIRTVSAGND